METFQVYEMALGALLLVTATLLGVKVARTPRDRVEPYWILPRLLGVDYGNRFDRFAMWTTCALLGIGGVLFIVAGVTGVDLNER